MLLAGSSAIKYHFPDFKRDPKDIDLIVNNKSLSSSKNTEYLYNPILGDLEGVASPDILYTLKISHVIGWDIKWEKHMFDIQFLKNKGCKLNIDLFYKLYKFWNEHHGVNKRSDLDMPASDFFNNALKTPHDYYHTILNPSPIYLKILKDGAEVDVCEQKFKSLTKEDKYELVREEVMVMAFERYKEEDYRVAYSKMLKKFIINHSPIWEGLFIIENYTSLNKPLYNYREKINQKIK